MTDLDTIWGYMLEILKENHSDTVIKRLLRPVLSSAEKLSARLGAEAGASV